MADLVVLGFDDKEQAERVMRLGGELAKQELIDLADAALAWREPGGKVKIQQSLPTTATGAAAGALWGSLIGLIFLAPVAGMAIGAAAGAVSGKLTDIGINDHTIKEIAATLEPGKAAVFALVRKSTPDKVREALQPYHPKVIQTSLTKEREEELVAALQA